MPRSRVSLFGWIVAIAFILGTALVYVDKLNLVATPPQLPEDTNLVDRMLGIADYRQAVWPLFLWTNLAFAIGFAATVAFAANIVSVSGVSGRLPTFRSLATVGGIIGAISSVIPLGAVNASVWELYCDCGFKETEIVSGVRAQIVAEDVGVWLGRFAVVVLAFGVIALVREARGLLSPTFRTWSYLLAIALVLAPLLGITEITKDPIEEELVAAVTGFVLVPVWAIWLGRTVEAGSASATT